MTRSMILVGDVRDRLRQIADESVHCAMTSPPYFNLRDYNCQGQIGLEATPDLYVAELVAVFREVRRVLRSDGVFFLNLGDSYVGGGRGGNPSDSHHQKQKTNRGSVSMPANAPRVIACDTHDKELADSLARDCLCGSLCDACRVAYRIGKSHNDYSLASTQAVSISESIRAHTELQFDHPPTSDSILPANHIEVAIQDRAHNSPRAVEPPLVSRATMRAESFPQHRGDCLPLDTPSACRLCAQPLVRDVLTTERNSVCTCDTAMRSGASFQRKSDSFCGDSAYRDLTTKTPASQSLSAKQRLMIPARVALALQADGWWLRDEIVWHKPNPMPVSVTDRTTPAHEMLYMFSKSARYHYDMEAIKEPIAESSKKRYAQASIETQSGGEKQDAYEAAGITGGSRRPNEIVKSLARQHKQDGTGNRQYDGFNERFFAKQGSQKLAEQAIARTGGLISGGTENSTLGTSGTLRQPRSVWTIATRPFKGAHFATFPPDLVRPCVKAGCPVGGTVLDPFSGAATTGLVAAELGRNYLGIELNPEYARIAADRLGLRAMTPDNLVLGRVA